MIPGMEGMPTAHGMELSAAILRADAERWDNAEIPGGPERASEVRTVADALDQLTVPLRQFEEAMDQGESPLDFLMAMQSGMLPVEAQTDQPQEG